MILLLVFISCGKVFADAAKDAEFNDLVDSLREEGVIPRVRGSVTYFGNFEDNSANMGYSQWFTITEAENFVLKGKLTWTSASTTPSFVYAGCGVVFGADPATGNHLLLSVRMDGFVYMSGTKGQTPLSYGRYYYGNPWWEGSADIMLVLNGDTASFYMNGQRMFAVPGVLIQGNGVGPAALSGTYSDFGTRCTWEDLYLFSWEGNN